MRKLQIFKYYLKQFIRSKIKYYIRQMKTPDEMEFDQLNTNLGYSIDTFMQTPLNNYSQKKLDEINAQYKKLKAVLQRIEVQLKSKAKSINKMEIHEKISRYLKELERTAKRIKEAENKVTNYMKGELFKQKNSSNTPNPVHDSQMQNLKKAQGFGTRYIAINRQAEHVQETTNLTNQQHLRQKQALRRIQQHQKDAQQQLSLADQLTRVINNRALKSKLILILLILFMGIADFFVLVLKIT